ncbi:MAG: Uncharacterized protein SCO3165, partial [uncultured Microvirga sp.]
GRSPAAQRAKNPGRGRPARPCDHGADHAGFDPHGGRGRSGVRLRGRADRKIARFRGTRERETLSAAGLGSEPRQREGDRRRDRRGADAAGCAKGARLDGFCHRRHPALRPRDRDDDLRRSGPARPRDRLGRRRHALDGLFRRAKGAGRGGRGPHHRRRV